MHASIDGLAEWLHVTTDELKARNPDIERDLEGVEHRLLAYIIPREPRTAEETEALVLAVYRQYLHEQTKSAKMMIAAGSNLASFRIGEWQAAYKNGSGRVSELFPAGLSHEARAVLLHAGLCYRGGVILT